MSNMESIVSSHDVKNTDVPDCKLYAKITEEIVLLTEENAKLRAEIERVYAEINGVKAIRRTHENQ